MTNAGRADPARRAHRCSGAARWLPRIMAASLLASAAAASFRLDPNVFLAGTVRALVLAAGAVGALWIVRGGSEVRAEITVGAKAISFAFGRKSVELPLAHVDAIDYQPALAALRQWLPAAVLVDRFDRRWRIPAFIQDGPALLDDILAGCGRDDLRSWSDARRIAPRMARSGAFIPMGYIASAALLAAALFFFYA